MLGRKAEWRIATQRETFTSSYCGGPSREVIVLQTLSVAVNNVLDSAKTESNEPGRLTGFSPGGPQMPNGGQEVLVISNPRMVPVLDANLSASMPNRCSTFTKIFGSG